MRNNLTLNDDDRADVTEADRERNDGTHQVSGDLAYQRTILVNVIFYGPPQQPGWVLIDAGLNGSADAIQSAADARFGCPPSAIILTHGHFDHVGALETLADRWGVPIFAHELEHPYLDGTHAYPPPDPTVGGGLMARLSPFYPRGPYNVSRWLATVRADGSLPFMPGWQWIHTPGHTPGHISLWRESDRTLIVGDAFITTKQESAYAVMTQQPVMHGPPAYYTQDWDDAARSVRRLAALEPELVIPGHGRAFRGEGMRQALRALAADFEAIAVPEHVTVDTTGQRRDVRNVTE